MDAQEATKKIAELTASAMTLIRQAEKIADENGVSFSFDVAYGMGGTYTPKSSDGWNSSGCSDFGDDSSGWQSSSSGC